MAPVPSHDYTKTLQLLWLCFSGTRKYPCILSRTWHRLVVDLIAIVSSALFKMNDEKPVQMRKRARPSTDRLSGRICIVHYAHSKQTDTEVRQMTDQAFQIIKNAAFLREKQDNPCYKLLEICHQIPAQLDSEKHGMHRWCYRNFTNVGKLKKLDEGRVRTVLPGGHGQQSKDIECNFW